MKIYTRAGDDGRTGLFGGPRVDKDHARIEAYGAVDELNATLGLARATLAVSAIEEVFRDELDALMERVQSDLFSVGAELATPEPAAKGMNMLVDMDVERLEVWIDRYEAELPPLRVFVLPAGSESAARLHVARTTCRRAERRIWSLAKAENVELSPPLPRYLNRLSDLLFVLSRFANRLEGREDTPWRAPG